jgi:hypothetical protein
VNKLSSANSPVNPATGTNAGAGTVVGRSSLLESSLQAMGRKNLVFDFVRFVVC